MSTLGLCPRVTFQLRDIFISMSHSHSCVICIMFQGSAMIYHRSSAQGKSQTTMQDVNITQLNDELNDGFTAKENSLIMSVTIATAARRIVIIIIIIIITMIPVIHHYHTVNFMVVDPRVDRVTCPRYFTLHAECSANRYAFRTYPEICLHFSYQSYY